MTSFNPITPTCSSFGRSVGFSPSSTSFMVSDSFVLRPPCPSGDLSDHPPPPTVTHIFGLWETLYLTTLGFRCPLPLHRIILTFPESLSLLWPRCPGT